MPLTRRPLAERFATAFDPRRRPRVGVAVSGGGDSMALLHLLQGCGAELEVATVDHGLRAGSKAEAEAVAAYCAAQGLPHEILSWTRSDTKGNLQAEARKARQRLLAEWGQRRGLPAICLGHTRDDQAETVLLRLIRGSGIDGLSAMAPERHFLGIAFLRPLLAMGGQELRDHLRAHGVQWFDDPSNENPEFDRVRVRQALESLAPLGLTAEALAATAGRLQATRGFLAQQTEALGRSCLGFSDAGAVTVNLVAYREAHEDLRHRLLGAVLRHVGRTEYPPRRERLVEFEQKMLAGEAATLNGCETRPEAEFARVAREPSACAAPVPDTAGRWDGWAWQAVASGQTVRALGEDGLRFCPDWRASGHPRRVLMATPSLWRGTELLAAPLAGLVEGWHCWLEVGEKDFYDALAAR